MNLAFLDVLYFLNFRYFSKLARRDRYASTVTVKMEFRKYTLTINMKNAIIALFLLASGMANAQVGSAWAWDSGKISNNGNVNIKSNNGSSSYSAVANPTGATAKINQSSVTQPPTVIIQATSGASGASLPFNYKDDCYAITLIGYSATSYIFIGAGKITPGSPATFSGVIGGFRGGSNAGSGQIVMSALLGVGSGGSANYNPYWCGADAGCVYGYGFNNYIVSALNLPTNTYQKCYQ